MKGWRLLTVICALWLLALGAALQPRSHSPPPIKARRLDVTPAPLPTLSVSPSP